MNQKQGTKWYPVFFVMTKTGLRVSEITGLRWCDIDLKKHIETIILILIAITSFPLVMKAIKSRKKSVKAEEDKG